MRGRLLPGLRPDHPAVRDALRDWPGSVYLDGAAEGADAVLVRALEPYRPRWWLHFLLFLATLVTTLVAGALMSGVDPLGTRVVDAVGVRLPLPTRIDPSALLRGSGFAVPFLAILLAHEMAHYVAARRHAVSATPPFFIPFPPYWSIIGTLGAFIRIRGPTVRRSILLDIGAAGPIASFALSIPALWFGLGLSRGASGTVDPATPFVIFFAGQPIWLGSGLLTHAFASFHLPGVLGTTPVVLHPLAFAGWLGLFFTALNLLPFGQLDGGHVSYALSTRGQRWAARFILLTLIPLGLLWWGWWFWALVAVAVSRGRLDHPRVLQAQIPLGPVRRSVAWLCAAILLLTVVPLPVRL